MQYLTIIGLAIIQLLIFKLINLIFLNELTCIGTSVETSDTKKRSKKKVPRKRNPITRHGSSFASYVRYSFLAANIF